MLRQTNRISYRAGQRSIVLQNPFAHCTGRPDTSLTNKAALELHTTAVMGHWHADTSIEEYWEKKGRHFLWSFFRNQLHAPKVVPHKPCLALAGSIQQKGYQGKVFKQPRPLSHATLAFASAQHSRVHTQISVQAQVRSQMQALMDSPLDSNEQAYAANAATYLPTMPATSAAAVPLQAASTAGVPLPTTAKRKNNQNQALPPNTKQRM